MSYKKEYRSSEHYKENMNAILEIIRTDIMPHFTFIDDNFSSMQTDNIFKYGFSYDFNDALIVELTKQQNAILITNDGDCANYNIDFQIVTSNSILLATH